MLVVIGIVLDGVRARADDLEDRRREHKFYTQLSRGEIKNERRHQARSTMLFLLLATAIATLSAWIYNFLQGLQ